MGEYPRCCLCEVAPMEIGSRNSNNLVVSWLTKSLIRTHAHRGNRCRTVVARYTQICPPVSLPESWAGTIGTTVRVGSKKRSAGPKIEAQNYRL